MKRLNRLCLAPTDTITFSQAVYNTTDDAGTVTIRVPDPLPDGTVSDVAATAGGAATMENGEPVAPVTPAEETLGVYAPVALIARLLKVATPFTADVVGASDPGVTERLTVALELATLPKESCN